MLEGGFAALVSTMAATKGCVDPKVLVGHDEGRWAAYCSNYRGSSSSSSSSSSGNINEETSSLQPRDRDRDRDKTMTVDSHHENNDRDQSNPYSSSTSSSSNTNTSNSKGLFPGPGQGMTVEVAAIAADISNVSGMINVKKARDSLSTQQQMKMALEVTVTLTMTVTLTLIETIPTHLLTCASVHSYIRLTYPLAHSTITSDASFNIPSYPAYQSTHQHSHSYLLLV